MKTLILTPNKNEMCGMYQLAKDLAKEFDGEIKTKHQGYNPQDYDEVITFLYPMHQEGYRLKREYRLKWICYNQGIPPVTKTYFPNFFRRQAMKYINWRNNITMQSADEYWDVTERDQKPRWTKKAKILKNKEKYAVYIGRTTDYKNFEWLNKTLKDLDIKCLHPQNISDEDLHLLLSNAKMLVTASLWEGFGRPVMEAEALGISAVAYDVGTHKKHIKKGVCVPLDINNMAKSEKLYKEAVLEVYNR